MLCPHCRHHFHSTTNLNYVSWGGSHTGWGISSDKCSNCGNFIFELIEKFRTQIEVYHRVYPLGSSRPPVPKEVPSQIASIYTEACLVLPLSTKASAALSRRCLQDVLRAHGYKANDLGKEIQKLLDEADPVKAIPQALRDTIDAIRNFGNFSAHPINDATSLQVIDVEPEEAEWCLEILEAMFEHFYVAPALAKARKDALNAKLKAANKPPAK